MTEDDQTQHIKHCLWDAERAVYQSDFDSALQSVESARLVLRRLHAERDPHQEAARLEEEVDRLTMEKEHVTNAHA